jgi:4-hydroxybenzoate polyprenyltransferase
MRPFFQLIRWKNLVMIAMIQFLVKYALLRPFYNSHGVVTALSDLAFYLLVLSTLCIAAAGYIINDVYDVASDKINKPDRVIVNRYISEKTALSLFIVLNIIGVGLGFYLSNGIGQSGFFVLFFISSALLYMYSSYFKRIPVVGNIIVSLLVALSIILIGIFELLPVITESNRSVQILFFKLILDYAIFAFMINLLRELVKDFEDIKGDYKMGIKTLPIALGIDRSNVLTFVLSLIPIAAVIYYLITYLFKQTAVVGYFLILVLGPLIYVSIKLFSAKAKEDYSHISFILKFVMLTGILSILLYPYILK